MSCRREPCRRHNPPSLSSRAIKVVLETLVVPRESPSAGLVSKPGCGLAGGFSPNPCNTLENVTSQSTSPKAPLPTIEAITSAFVDDSRYNSTLIPSPSQIIQILQETSYPV
ncbi:hypothetical protein V6N11_027225 [Hibiscus sabdariffa]|uniref:Uncharacterized protein n=1 Tax=Hibiscus sabdariffa TaxID=183260 RepID=A0ABR2PGC8_9ROSI